MDTHDTWKDELESLMRAEWNLDNSQPFRAKECESYSAGTPFIESASVEMTEPHVQSFGTSTFSRATNGPNTSSPRKNVASNGDEWMRGVFASNRTTNLSNGTAHGVEASKKASARTTKHQDGSDTSSAGPYDCFFQPPIGHPTGLDGPMFTNGRTLIKTPNCEECRRALSAWKQKMLENMLDQPRNFNKTPDFSLKSRALSKINERCSFCQFLQSCVSCHPGRWNSTPENIKTQLLLILDVAEMIPKALTVGAMQETWSYRMFPLKPRAIQHDGLPWPRIRQWIKNCDSQHNHAPLSVSNQYLKTSPIWLIDVECCCLVRSNPTNLPQYAALSYVWGNSKQVLLNSETIGEFQGLGYFERAESCPQTVRDAIEVCRRTEIRYLWVDCLCVKQDDDPLELERSIQNMDAIYSNASFTIVPADSESASQGIYGISIPRSQPCYGEEEFFFQLQSVGVYSALSDSIWASRGWTYQESILSRRLLVFMANNCFLLCPSAVSREDSEDIYPGSRMGTTEDTGLSPTDIYSLHISQYFQLVIDYSGRQLTKPEDRLRAFSGIMNALDPTMEAFHFGLLREYFLPSLTWRTNRRFSRIFLQMQTFITSDRTLCRNDFIPSWSWAGWTLDYETVFHFPSHFQGVSMVQILSITKDGDWQVVNQPPDSSRKFKTSMDEDDILLAPFLVNSEEKAGILNLWPGSSAPRDSVLIFKTLVFRLAARVESNSWYVVEGLFRENDSNKKSSRIYRISETHKEVRGGESEFAVIGIQISQETGFIKSLVALELLRSGDVAFRTDWLEFCPDLEDTEMEKAHMGNDISLADLIEMGDLEIIILG